MSEVPEADLITLIAINVTIIIIVITVGGGTLSVFASVVI